MALAIFAAMDRGLYRVGKIAVVIAEDAKVDAIYVACESLARDGVTLSAVRPSAARLPALGFFRERGVDFVNGALDQFFWHSPPPIMRALWKRRGMPALSFTGTDVARCKNVRRGKWLAASEKQAIGRWGREAQEKPGFQQIPAMRGADAVERWRIWRCRSNTRRDPWKKQSRRWRR